MKTPEIASGELASRLKALRLAKRWKRSTLAKRSGVSEASLRRFEASNKISLENFLKLMFALGRIDEVDALLAPSAARSIKELEDREKKAPQRGTI